MVFGQGFTRNLGFVSFHHSWDETWLMAGEVHEQIAQL
jgi:hypothetical protein